MKLVAFRVQNYKKIQDTGWITVRDLTAFVGKNESGKSTLFRGLSKINPSDGEKYDGLREFPRRRYTDEFKKQDWPVASCKFELNDSEHNQLRDICTSLTKVKQVVCTRHYSWKLTVEFDPAPSTSELTCADFKTAIDEFRRIISNLTAPEGKGDSIGAMKNALLQTLTNLETQLSTKKTEDTIPKADVQKLMDSISTQSNEQLQKELLKDISERVSKLLQRASFVDEIKQAKKWVEDNLPKFTYFDRYDVIDSAIHLPSFSQQLNQNPPPPRVRTTRCLFEYVGLDIKRLATLGQHQPGNSPNEEIRRLIDERSINLSSASSAMTAKFQDWWEQRRHKFRYQADGDYFRIWVSDDLDPSEIELDQRSLGMQYFFSFFTVFLVEAQNTHQNAILLLDEPGLHMHGTAQAKIIKFLEKLSQYNQTMYTTHSPFMVDADHLERVRIVYEADDGTTKVSEDVWPRDKDALFPLQAGLGYQLVQSLFIAKRQLIVEGLTDYWILKAFDQTLRHQGKTALRDDIVIVPSAGLNKLLPLASMLIGHDVEIVALLDGDEPGRKEGKKLSEKLLTRQTGRCLFIGDFVENNPEAELEDIFPNDLYLQAVKETYSISNLAFGKEEESIKGIVNKIDSLFQRNNIGKFEKWRVAAFLRDRINSEPDKIADGVWQIANRIFDAVNKAFEANN